MADSVSDFPPQIVACGNLRGAGMCLGGIIISFAADWLSRRLAVIFASGLLMLTAANTREDFPVLQTVQAESPAQIAQVASYF